MPTRKTQKSESGEVQVPPTSTPKTGAGAGAARQPRTTGETGAGAASAGGAPAKPTGAAKSGGAKTTRGAGGGKTDSGSKAGARSAGKRAGGAPTGADLQKALRDFAAARPNGWNHDDWENFLQELQSRGHNINDREQIGAMLEKERVAVVLGKVPGVGPQRVRSIADKFGSVWQLREAGPEAIAREAGVPRQLADRISEAVR
jgi:hypothetical protein